MVKGTGQVTQIHTESQAGTALVEIPGLVETVALQIGPVVRGTALRDATGAVSFNQFTNQLDYADVAKEMNRRALQTAFANVDPASLPGKTITFCINAVCQCVQAGGVGGDVGGESLDIAD